MTDMRATEWLLEVIAERARLVDEGELLTQQGITEIRQAAEELRRRGDTLVRAEDLVAVLEAAARGTIGSHQTGWPHGAAARLEDALGGKR